MKKHKSYKPRNINLKDTVIKRQVVKAGDSLEIVSIPKWLQRRMKFNIRQNARRSNVVFPLRQKIAREMLEDFNIPFLRPKGN